MCSVTPRLQADAGEGGGAGADALKEAARAGLLQEDGDGGAQQGRGEETQAPHWQDQGRKSTNGSSAFVFSVSKIIVQSKMYQMGIDVHLHCCSHFRAEI